MTDKALPAADDTRHGFSSAYLDALAAMDEEVLVAAFAVQAVVELPTGSTPRKGRAAIRELFRSLFAVAVPIKLEEQLVIAAPGSEAVSWTGLWRAAGGDVDSAAIDVFELDPDGRIRQWRAYWRQSALLGDAETATRSRAGVHSAGAGVQSPHRPMNTPGRH